MAAKLDPNADQQVYRPSPLSIWLAAAFSVTLTVFQVQKILQNEVLAGHDLWIFFISCAVDLLLFAQIFGVLAYMKITRDGFEYRRLYQYYKLSWWEVSEFRLASDARGFLGDRGAIVFDSDQHKPGPLRHVSKLVTGGHEQIMAYGTSPHELVDALNAARRAAITSGRPGPSSTFHRPLVA